MRVCGMTGRELRTALRSGMRGVAMREWTAPAPLGNRLHVAPLARTADWDGLPAPLRTARVQHRPPRVRGKTRDHAT